MIKLTFSGDFAPSKILLDKIDSTSITEFLGDLYSVVESADLNVTNLEAPIVDRSNPLSKYGPPLATDKRAVDLLCAGNFNLVTLANNHIMDHNVSGLKNTFKILKENKIEFLGAGLNLTEAREPVIKRIGDTTIGMLNFAENEFSTTFNDTPGASPLDIIENSRQILELKEAVDFVIVIVHGGAELHEYPSPRFKKTLRFFADMGANLIVSHHTHRFNGYEIYEKTPIFYGLGNFIFDSKTLEDKKWSLGAMLEVNIQEDKTLHLKLHPFLQNYRDYGIFSLKEDDMVQFEEFVKKSNEIIKNDKLLENEYNNFVDSVTKQYQHYLQPFTSKYLHKLYSLGILPSFLKNEKKKLLYQNLIRCEAHRDILLKILK